MTIDLFQSIALLVIAAASLYQGLGLNKRISALEGPSTQLTGDEEHEILETLRADEAGRLRGTVAELIRALPPWRTDLHRVLERSELWVGPLEMRTATCDSADCPLHNPRGFARKVSPVDIHEAVDRLSDDQRRELFELVRRRAAKRRDAAPPAGPVGT